MESFPDWKKIYRMNVVVASAIIAALFIYALIVEFIKIQFKPFRGFVEISEIQILRYALYGAAIVAVVVIRVLQRPFLVELPGEDMPSFLQKLSRGGILTAVLCEIPAVLGLILFLLTGLSRDFYILLSVSLFLEFMYFPRARIWEERMQRPVPDRKL